MYLHIPVHGNIQVNICLILGCWGGIFFFWHKSSGGHHEKKIHILHYVI